MKKMHSVAFAISRDGLWRLRVGWFAILPSLNYIIPKRKCRCKVMRMAAVGSQAGNRQVNVLIGETDKRCAYIFAITATIKDETVSSQTKLQVSVSTSDLASASIPRARSLRNGSLRAKQDEYGRWQCRDWLKV